jgi:hypothetical protein
MYSIEIENNLTDHIDVIKNKTLTGVCSEVICHNNGVIYDKTNEYIVNFIDSKGNTLLTITENALSFALFGTENEIDTISDDIKEYSQKYWEMDHNIIEVIEFNNPSHAGEVLWNVDDDESDISESEHLSYESDNSSVCNMNLTHN